MKLINLDSIVEDIKQKRIASGLTQDELAKKVGCKRTTINMIESGNRQPSMELLKSLYGVLPPYQIPDPLEVSVSLLEKYVLDHIQGRLDINDDSVRKNLEYAEKISKLAGYLTREKTD